MELHLVLGSKQAPSSNQSPCDSKSITWLHSEKIDNKTLLSNAGEAVSVVINDQNKIVIFYVKAKELYYQSGELNIEGYEENGSPILNSQTPIIWQQKKFRYDNGNGYGVTADMNSHGQIVELHHDGKKNLFVSLGKLSSNGVIRWVGGQSGNKTKGRKYDTGVYPFVSIDDTGQIIEGHLSNGTRKWWVTTAYWDPNKNPAYNDIADIFGAQKNIDNIQAPDLVKHSHLSVAMNKGYFVLPRFVSTVNTTTGKYEYQIGSWHQEVQPAMQPPLQIELETREDSFNEFQQYNYVTLNWNSTAFLQRKDALLGFEVLRDYEILETLAPSQTTYIDRPCRVAPGLPYEACLSESYTYQVQAKFAGSTAVASEMLTVETNYLSRTLTGKTDDTLSFEWSLAQDQGKQTQFVIYRNNVPIATLGPNVYQFTDADFITGNTYEYIIEASFPNYSLRSRVLTVGATNGLPIDYLQGSVMDPYSIDLSWHNSFPATQGDEYAIYRKDNKDDPDTLFNLIDIIPGDYLDFSCSLQEPGFLCYRDKGNFIPGDGEYGIPGLNTSNAASKRYEDLNLLKMKPVYYITKIRGDWESEPSNEVYCALGGCVYDTPINYEPTLAHPQIIPGLVRTAIGGNIVIFMDWSWRAPPPHEYKRDEWRFEVYGSIGDYVTPYRLIASQMPNSANSNNPALNTERFMSNLIPVSEQPSYIPGSYYVVAVNTKTGERYNSALASRCPTLPTPRDTICVLSLY